jgi:hypothetical protein
MAGKEMAENEKTPGSPGLSDATSNSDLFSGTGGGASEGIRTLDIHLGKVTLYQAELHSRLNNAALNREPEP